MNCPSLPRGRAGTPARILLFLVLISGTVFLFGCARAQIIHAPAAPAVPGAATAAVIPAPRLLPVGEKLEYQVAWWGVPVGNLTLSLLPVTQKEMADLRSSVAGQVKGLVKMNLEGGSNRYLQAFYPVRVEMTSFLDPQSRAPYRFYAYVKRRWRIHQSTVTFDRREGTAFHQLPKGKGATVPVGPATQDGLSVIYYSRTLDFPIGQTIPLEVSADGKNWHLEGKIVNIGKMELKRLGTWPTVEGSAELAYPVPFFQGARARIWFTADSQRIPLLAKIHSRIGPVTVVLTQRTATPAAGEASSAP